MPRPFSLQERLALMMTSAGSMRRLASFVGASHQQVGRWLSIGQTDATGAPSRVREPGPEQRAMIAAAFEVHTDAARDQAAVDRIPFSEAAPVYARRTTYSDGTPGQRVEIDKLHHVSDALRSHVVRAWHALHFYFAVSASSLVEDTRYWFNAENRIDLERVKRDQDMEAAQERLAPALDDDELTSTIKRMNTTYAPMGPGVRVVATLDTLNRSLSERHAPAVGEKGTVLADKLLFQTNSRVDTYGKQNADDRRKRRNREAMQKRRADAVKQAAKKQRTAKPRARKRR